MKYLKINKAIDVYRQDVRRPCGWGRGVSLVNIL